MLFYPVHIRTKQVNWEASDRILRSLNLLYALSLAYLRTLYTFDARNQLSWRDSTQLDGLSQPLHSCKAHLLVSIEILLCSDIVLSLISATGGIYVERNVTSPAGVYLDYQNVKNGSLQINGTSLEYITILDQTYITEIIAPNVEFITESIYIVNAPRLKRLWFPKLKEVKGISIRDAPSLSTLSGNFFPGNGITLTSTAGDEYNGYEKLVIANTGIKALSLNSVPGVGLGDGTIQVLNNPRLEKFTLTGLVRGPRDIIIQDNGAKLKTKTQVSFPDLENSWQMDINFASRVDLPQLRNSSGTLKIWKSTMKYLELPALVNAGAVVILLNPNLERIEMPVFETIIRYAEEDGTGWVLGIYDNDKLTAWTAPPRYRRSPEGEWTVLHGNFKK